MYDYSFPVTGTINTFFSHTVNDCKLHWYTTSVVTVIEISTKTAVLGSLLMVWINGAALASWLCSDHCWHRDLFPHSSHCGCYRSASKLRSPLALHPTCVERGDRWLGANQCQTVKQCFTTWATLLMQRHMHCWDGVTGYNYEGRSINKLQNRLILLVFQILKIRNIRFVGNLILSSSCEFFDDDVIVT